MKSFFLSLLIVLLPLFAIAEEAKWSLERCMEYAVEHSYATTRSANALRTAREDYTNAIGRHLPSISGSVGAGVNFGRGIDPATNTYVTMTTFQNGYSANLSLPIFNAFELLNNTLYSRINKIRASSELQKAKDDVALLVMSSYVDVLYNKGLVDLTRQKVETSQRDLTRTERESSLGTKSIADVAQIAANLSSEEFTLVTRENELQKSELRLKDVMNFPIDSLLSVDDKIAIKNEATLADAAEIYNTTGSLLPAWDIYNKSIEASKYQLKMAKSAYYPSLSASAGISTNYYNILGGGKNGYDRFGKQVNENLGEWAQVNLSIPIFNGMSARTSIHKAKIAHSQAKSDYSENMRLLRSTIEQAVMDLQGAQKQLVGAERSVEAFELAHKAARHKWDEGLISIIELQTSANQFLASRVELLGAQLRYAAKCREVNYYKGLPLF